MSTQLMQNREKVKKFIEKKSFDLFIMALICLDAIVFGLMTSVYYDKNFSGILYFLDRLCMSIFMIELTLKLYVYSKDFFKSRWNIFDFIIITVSSCSFASYFIVLRTFRLFRLLKYINKFSKLKHILNIFSTLLPNFIALALLFGVFLYVFAIMAVSLYGNVFIEFATLPSSVFSLMQIFTLDGWASVVARPVMSVFPHSWIFFISFLLISFLLIISFLMSVIDELIKRNVRYEKHKSNKPFKKKINKENK